MNLSFWLRIKHPLLWPSVSYGSRENLPRVSGFYAVSSLGWVHYIGRSNNINRRWNATGEREHHRTNQVTDLVFPRLHFIQWPESRLKKDERRLINALKPTWNDTKVPKNKWSMAELVSIGLMIALVLALWGELGHLVIDWMAYHGPFGEIFGRFGR